MSKLVIFFFMVTAAAQFVSGVVGVRKWPFSDYPMFLKTSNYFHSTAKIRYKIIFKNGRQVWAPRTIGLSFGVTKVGKSHLDPKTLKNIEVMIMRSIDHYFKDRVNKIEKVQIVKRIASRTGEGHLFDISEQVLHEFRLYD